MTVLLIGLLSCQNQKPAENGSFTTASYNLRYANAEDSAAGNGWGKRYPVMAKLIQYHSFDIFGTQEGYIRQLEDMKAALPGYEYIGVGRNDGKEAGEHSAIFYRTDKFDLIKKGDFWLSETPDTASIGWDAVLQRYRIRVPFLQSAYGSHRKKSAGGKCLPRTGEDERTRSQSAGYPHRRFQCRPDTQFL